MADNYYEFKTTFDSTIAAVRALQAQILHDADEAQLAGDDIKAARLRMQAAEVGGPQVGEVAAANAEIKAQQTALQGVNAEVLAGIDLLKETNAQYLEQVALTERLQRSGLVIPNVPRRYTSYESYQQTAGAQSTAERARAVRAEQLATERAIAQQIADENALLAEQQNINRAILGRGQEAYAAGRQYGAEGKLLPQADLTRLRAAPTGVPPAAWETAQKEQVSYMARLGEFRGLTSQATAQTEAFTGSLVRLGLADSQVNQQMRRHGALTTEWLGALARGETTVNELGYQVGATIGKFAGWVTAAAATYTALGAIYEIGKGAVDSASGVQQLTRTIDGLDRNKAATALSGLSAAVNVPIKEAADATFLYSRTFHDLAGAVLGAKSALSVFKLDQVSVNDSMQLSTLLSQQFGRSAQDQQVQWDMLAAGQREYNARISQTVPLLRNATGAVRASGGDLDQLVQLAILATRTYPGQGANIGTAFARGASSYTPKNLPDLQQHFGLGYGEEATNWTLLLQHAIAKSATMGQSDIRKLASDIFDPRFGSRLLGIFGPRAAATLATETGQGPKAITPEATKGSLQRELDTQLGTLKERLHSFVNEMQRFGVAVGASGVLTVFGDVISGLVKIGGAFRGVIEAFDGLSAPVRDVVEALVALRVASLFVSRTRIGGSIPGISSIPGFRPSAGTLARQDIQLGTRNAITALDGQIASNSAKSLSIGRQLTTIGEQQRQLGAQQYANKAEEKAAADASTKLQEDILTLEREQTAIERELNAQYVVRRDLTSKNVAASSSRRDIRYSDPEALAVANSMGLGQEAAAAQTTKSMGLSAYIAQRAGVAKAAVAAKIADETGAIGIFGKASADQTAAMKAETVASDAAGAEALTAKVALKDTAYSVAELGLKIEGFVAGIDPLLAAFIVLPIAYGAISSAVSATDNAVNAATRATQEPIHNLQDLQRSTQHLHTASQKLKDQLVGSNLPGFLGSAERNFFDFYAPKLGLEPTPQKAAQTAGAAQVQKGITDFYDKANTKFAKDADALAATAPHSKKLYDESQRLKQTMGRLLQGSGMSKSEINRIYGAFTVALQNDYNAGIALAAGRAKGKNLIDLLDRESTKDLSKSVQGYSDRADIYGLKGMDWTRLGDTYLLLAARYRNSTDQTGLQLVKTAQQALVTAVNKNVTDLQLAAESQTTESGFMADTNAAVSTIQAMKGRVQQWETAMEQHFKNYPKIIAAVKAAAAQIDAQLNDKLKSAIDEQLQAMKTASDLAASQIQGTSPETDIARAQVVLTGLQQELAKAKSEGASWLVLAGLMTQINNQATALAKQRIDNARGILDAQGQLQTAQITGIGPQDDIARAQSDLQTAQNLLAFDQSHGAGQKQILDDQVAVANAQRSLNQSIQQRDAQLRQDLAAFIQAQAALAESQTTNPVTQANEELQAAIKVLGTINPADYKTYQEYQTAVLNQTATVNKDKQNVTQQIADTDLRNLQFELATQRITDQQYLNGLEKILKLKKLSQQTRQTILQDIFNVTNQSAIDLNLGSLKMPTTYEVRSALARGAAALAGRGATAPENITAVMHAPVTNEVKITVYVDSRRDPHIRAVTDAVVKGLNQSTSQAQSAGLIGV